MSTAKRSLPFQDIPGLVVAISTKADGNMRLSGDMTPDERVWKNRDAFLGRYDVTREQLVRPEMQHTGNVQVVRRAQCGSLIPNTDGLITMEPGVFLMVTMADCLPIFLYDPERRAIGLAHAGWRGLEQRILTNTMQAMKEQCMSNPENVLVAIGPGIGVDHYDVADDRVALFAQYADAAERREGKTYLNLKRIAQEQAQECGVLYEHITIDATCTQCAADRYFSSRRDRPAPLKTQMALFGMRG